MGNPHKGFVVEGERGFWVVERQKQKAETAEIVGCVGAIHRSWTDLKKVGQFTAGFFFGWWPVQQLPTA